jgi:hypothetical protein
MKIAAALALLWVALAPVAWAQDECDACRKAAVAEGERCRKAAPSATMEWALCNVKMGEARHACRLRSCVSRPAAERYALCDECVRDAEVQERICNNLPAGERRPCYARAAEMGKPCRESFCRPAR